MITELVYDKESDSEVRCLGDGLKRNSCTVELYIPCKYPVFHLYMIPNPLIPQTTTILKLIE